MGIFARSDLSLNHSKVRPLVQRVLAPSLLINILSLALPLTILQIYDRILPNQSYGTAAILLVGAFIALSTEAFLRYVRTWLLSASAANTERESYQQVIRSLDAANGKDLANLGAGGVSEGLKAVSIVKDYYSGGLVAALIDLPFVFIFLGLVYYVGGSLVLIPICVWLVASIAVLFASQRARLYSKEAAEGERGRASFLIRVFGLLDNIKKQASESQIFASFRRINQHKWIATSKAEQQAAFAQECILVASLGTSVAIVLFGALVVLDGEMTTGGLAACSILSGRAVQPLSALIGLRMRFDSFEVADNTVREITSLASHGYFHGSAQLPPALEAYGARDLKFKRYDQQHSLNGMFSPGTITNIEHPSSFIRSQALGVLAGVNSFYSGDLTWNELPLSETSYQNFRRYCGYIPQRPVLFAGSLLDNLCGFNPDKTEQALAFAKALGLDPVIAELADGIETKVGGSLSSPLSLGAIRLANITAQLAAANRIVVIDSPEKYLDVSSRELLAKVLQYLASQGAVIIISSDEERFLGIAAQSLTVGDIVREARP